MVKVSRSTPKRSMGLCHSREVDALTPAVTTAPAFAHGSLKRVRGSRCILFTLRLPRLPMTTHIPSSRVNSYLPPLSTHSIPQSIAKMPPLKASHERAWNIADLILSAIPAYVVLFRLPKQAQAAEARIEASNQRARREHELLMARALQMQSDIYRES
jgi:hypothetical protein